MLGYEKSPLYKDVQNGKKNNKEKVALSTAWVLWQELQRECLSRYDNRMKQWHTNIGFCYIVATYKSPLKFSWSDEIHLTYLVEWILPGDW